MSVDLSGLNPEQLDAVNSTDGILRVLAGAGSGKTRVITYRIAHIIEDLGVRPNQILAFTFTNKAANEMKERLVSLIGEEKASAVWCGTMHSIFARILRAEAVHLGYTGHFVICDDDDTKSILNKLILPKIRGDEFDKRTDYPIVQGLISTCKNEMRLDKNSINAYVREQEDAGLILPKKRWAYASLSDIFEEYNKYLKEHDMMDFDDLLINVVTLFQEHQDIARYWSDLFKYILVDEFQDTNVPQFLAIQQLASVHKNLCVVGDDDQSIYGWRGAKPEIIVQFNQYFGKAETVKLERNYRSSGIILSAANSVISKNTNRTDKVLRPTKDQGLPLNFVSTDTSFDVASAMIREICALNNIASTAVLYRNNSDASLLEKALIKSKIPYTIIGGTSFYARAEIKNVLAYLRLVVGDNNMSTDPAFLRVCNEPARKLGDKTVAEIQALANLGHKSLLEASGLHNKGFAFYSLIKTLQKNLERLDMTLPKLVDLVIRESGLFDMYSDDRDKFLEGTEEYDKANDRLNNLKELVATAEAFMRDSETSDIKEQLTELLDTAVLAADAATANQDADCLRLMTVHKAKGLEFDHVLIGPCFDGKFPTLKDDSDIEEERRLMYVAITRARKTCSFYCPREIRQGKETAYVKPSRFLYDVPDNLWSQDSLYQLKEAKSGQTRLPFVADTRRSFSRNTYRNSYRRYY